MSGYRAGKVLGILLVLLQIALFLAFWGGVIFILFHFIGKFW